MTDTPDKPAAGPKADPAAPHPLDHDGDGRPGGVAPPPAIQHLVILADDPERGLSRGDVVGAADGLVRGLLKAKAARLATADEVDLAQPRVRTL